MTKWELLTIIGITLVILGFVYLANSSDRHYQYTPSKFTSIVYITNQTNTTSEMVYGDQCSCGYINATTTLESLRDCFRD